MVNFRNYEKIDFEFGDKTVLVGDNGTGKTNVLEAIYMLAVGKSFRAETDSELIRYGEPFVNIQCSGLNVQLRIFIDTRKRFEVNGVPRRMIDFAGKLKAVLFGPGDLEIITGSPSKRRRYLDFVIGQKDREYRRSLLSYEKGLRQRNKLLDLIRDGKAQRNQLWFWDRLLIKDGNYISEKRGEFLKYFNAPSQSPPNLGGEDNGGYKILYDKSVISEMRLKQYEHEEVMAGNTLVGPHRDDFIIAQILNPKFQIPNNNQNPNFNSHTECKDISKFGSRGQQRMAVLALKVWELKYLADGELPILLLDDVFSELDHEHQNRVLEIIEKHVQDGGQVIMTTADRHLVPKDGWKKTELHK